MMLAPRIGVESPYVLAKNLAVVRTVRFDNIDFHTVRFPATAPKKGQILILHGWCEHSLMYYRVMEFLSGLGYESMVYDQRGSGRTSLGKYRGRCGRDPAIVYRDLNHMMEYFSDEKSPLYLMGHSMGGGIALNYLVAAKFCRPLAGVIVTGPLIRLVDEKIPPAMLEHVLTFICYWFPYVGYGAINTDPAIKSTVTSAVEWVDYLQNELLTQGVSTLSQLKYMLDRARFLESLEPSSVRVDPKIKLLVLHAENDTYTSWRHSEAFVDKMDLEHKQFVKIRDAAHALFIERQEVFDEVCGHIERFLHS